jgi:kinesin family protein 22
MQPAIKTKCIRVAVRIRPLAAAALAAAASNGKIIQPAVVLDGTKALRLRESVSDSFGNSTTTESVFQFDACYDGFSKQADIYQSEVRPWLSDCWQGINTTVFCYGATGSGKTHTAAGTASDAGLIPRAVNELLSMCSAESKMSVKLSYMEIYNEKCIDLLPTSVVAGGQNAEGSCVDLPVREDANRRVQVIGLVEHELKNMDEFKRLFELGTMQRTCAATKLNAQSSRSHAVLMLKVERIENGKRYCGKLNLIDLAGSEDNRQTGNQGARMAESGSINWYEMLFSIGDLEVADLNL